MKGSLTKLWALLLPFLLLPWSSFAADGPREILLWPAGAPGSEGLTSKEIIEPPNADHGYFKVSNVHRPSVTVYLPSKDKATGVAVIICPGGAHRFLAIDIEGYNVAKWLSDQGIAGFVLKYRLAQTEGANYQFEVHSLQDAQRAIQLVRSRATEWGINPTAIGIMGFSAGGAVAALAGTRFEAAPGDATDPIAVLSPRPDFLALFYPGLAAGAFDVSRETPPVFLVHADNDSMGPERSSIPFYLALRKARVPAELHIYASGGHGFGLRTTNRLPVGSWPSRFQEWLADRGFLQKR